MEKIIATINGKSIGLIPSELEALLGALTKLKNTDPKTIKDNCVVIDNVTFVIVPKL